MPRERKSHVAPQYPSVDGNSMPVEYTVPTGTPLVGLSPADAVESATSSSTVGVGLEVAAAGWDEQAGHWSNVSRQVANINTGLAFNQRQLIPAEYQPKDLRGQLKRAQLWREGDELLEGLVKIKSDFSVVGFSAQARVRKSMAKAITQDQEDEVQESVDDFILDSKLFEVVASLFTDLYTTDNAVLYWRTKSKTDADVPVPGVSEVTPGLTDIRTIDPAICEYANVGNAEDLLVEVTPEEKRLIEPVFLKTTKEARIQGITELLQRGIGMKWIEAVHRGDRYVRLSKADGDNWLVITMNRKQNGFKKPSMRNVFLPLQTRKMFNEGEFVGSFMMKHFIMLIKQGESISGNGIDAGSRKNWLSKPEADTLTSIFSNVSLAMRMAVNHTTKVEFVFPPSEMFSIERFQSCEQKIFNWSGVVASVMQGSGGSYATAFIGIKKLLANLAVTRKLVADAMTRFFRDPFVRSQLQIPDGLRITIRFDENVLKEPKQILDEVRALLLEGVLDPRGAAIELGRDPDLIASRKYLCRKENEADKTWEPIYDRNTATEFRDGNDDEGGRPPNPGTEQSEGTRTQSPTAMS